MAERPRVALGLPAGAANHLLELVVGRLGVPVAGVWILRTRGRRTGRLHDVPVIPLTLDGDRYLVAPRGATDWMRNLVAGGGELRRGNRSLPVSPEPIEGEERVAILCAYIRANRRRNRRFFAVPDPFTPADVRAVAGRHPVVRLLPGG